MYNVHKLLCTNDEHGDADDDDDDDDDDGEGLDHRFRIRWPVINRCHLWLNICISCVYSHIIQHIHLSIPTLTLP